MSKKNKRSTRDNYLRVALEQEREAAEKKRAKAEKKQQREAVRAVAGKAISKTKKKGIRIRKGATVKGVKIVDSASKKKALQRLKAEQAEREMDVDAAPKQRKPKAAKKKVTVKLPGKKQQKEQGPAPME